MNVDAIRSAMTAFSTAMSAALDAAPAATSGGADASAQAAVEGARTVQAPVVTQPAAPAAPAAPAQRSAADEAAARTAAVAGVRAAAAEAGVNMTIFDGLAAGGEDLAGLRGLITARLATTTPEIDATRSAPRGEAQPQLVDFDRAVAAQRSDEVDVFVAGLSVRIENGTGDLVTATWRHRYDVVVVSLDEIEVDRTGTTRGWVMEIEKETAS